VWDKECSDEIRPQLGIRKRANKCKKGRTTGCNIYTECHHKELSSNLYILSTVRKT
jgi:hypothetical protein